MTTLHSILHARACCSRVDLLPDDLLGQPELGDAIDSTPPGSCRASKTVTSWPCLASSPAAVSPAGPEPTTATLLAARGAGDVERCWSHVLARPVGDEALEVADGHRLALLAADALDLALRLLRADAAGDAGQRVVVEQRCRRRPAGRRAASMLDEARDVDADRAAGDALGVLAQEAALGFEHGHLLR